MIIIIIIIVVVMTTNMVCNADTRTPSLVITCHICRDVSGVGTQT